MMQMALSIAPLSSIGQDDQNEVQHYLFGPVMPLALALVAHDIDSIVSRKITFLMPRYPN